MVQRSSSALNRKRILVTGGAGYVGSVMVPRLLEEGHEVIVLDNMLYGQTSLLGVAHHERFSFVRGDARDERLLRELLPQVEAIIPLAAMVGAPACDRDPILAKSLNVGAIHSLIKLRSPQQSIIFPMTNSGYGTQSGDVYCTEETPLEPISLYGQNKAQAEKELLESGNVVTLRMATIFGVSPRMRLDLLVNQFVYEALFRGYIVIYEKHFKRNYIHIRDVADCFNFCLENFELLKDEPYNLGLDEANYNKEELANLIKIYLPKLNIIFSDIGTDPDQRNYIVSNAKLQERGFTAHRGVEQGIQELIKAYQMLPTSGVNQNA
ncbi:NAD-dependent epimerase/dehydratase family protein [Chloroflexota bacterium]